MTKIDLTPLSLLVLASAGAGGVVEKPADLPERYRDFAIYTTSSPDPADDARIVMSIRLINRGRRLLPTRLVLAPNPKLGFEGDALEATLAPGTEKTWRPSFRPPDDLVKQVIAGKVFFGATQARDVFIAVRGRDPEGWRPACKPDVDDPAETLAITDRAQVVATYAPRVRIDWWRGHPSSTITPEQKTKPLVTLASNGKTAYAILLQLGDGADKADRHFQVALSDLARSLKTISGGAELAVVEERPAGKRAIVLRVDATEEWEHPDAYHLFTRPDGDVVIEAGHLDGLRNGIYGLLTDHLDCHWFMPGRVGEEIPTPADKTAAIGQIDQRRSPSFYSARGSTWRGGAWNYRNRNVARGGRISFGHAWASLLKGTPELYEKHPEWWARDRDGKLRLFDQKGGWSFTNFCTTNPEVMDLVAKKLNDRLSRPGAIITSVDPNDFAPFCLCETCTGLDRSYGAGNPDGSFSTDRMIHFANEMHRRLAPENRDKLLGFLVYGYQIQLPARAKPDPHVLGMICNMDWRYDHTRPMNYPTSPSSRKFLRLMKGWGTLLSQFGFYDYPTDYVHYAPYGQVMKLREDLPLARELGVTFTVIEGQPILATSALNLYICGRLQYDVNEDVDVLMEEFFHKFHGPAAEPMRKYWLGAEYYTATLRPGPRAQDLMTRLPEMWTELDGYLREAEAIVAKLPDPEKRFRDRVAYQRRGFELARRKCAIRDAIYAPRKKVRPEGLTAENRQRVEAYRRWIAATRKMHAESEGYWPPLIPGYYYAELEQFLTQALAEIDRAGASPKAAD